MSNERHKYRNGRPTRTFEGLSYPDQAKSINMTEYNLARMKEAHKRRAREEGRQ